MIDTTRQQSDLQFYRPECKTTLVCLMVTFIWSAIEIYHNIFNTFTCKDCASKKNTYITCTVYISLAHRLTKLISWQSRGPSVWHSRLLLRWTAAGWMAEWGAVTVALCSIEGGIDYVHLDSCTASRSSSGRRVMEPCDRDELAVKRFVRGGCRVCWRDRRVQIDRYDRWSLSHAFLCT